MTLVNESTLFGFGERRPEAVREFYDTYGRLVSAVAIRYGRTNAKLSAGVSAGVVAESKLVGHLVEL